MTWRCETNQPRADRDRLAETDSCPLPREKVRKLVLAELVEGTHGKLDG